MSGRRLEAGVGLALLAGLCALVTVVDPNQPGHYPTCPVLALTGHYCPGCGSLRALHDLFHGHVAAAAGHNVATVAFLPVAVVVGVRAALGRPARTPPAWVPLTTLALVVVWTVLRNLPWAPFSALAP